MYNKKGIPQTQFNSHPLVCILVFTYTFSLHNISLQCLTFNGILGFLHIPRPRGGGAITTPLRLFAPN